MRRTAEPLAFCELELTHAPGPSPGRYVVEPGLDDVADVLAVEVVGAPPPPVVPRLRRGGTKDVGGEPPIGDVALCRVRLVRPGAALADERAARALMKRWRASDEEREAWVDAALQAANRAIRAFRIAAQNPFVHELGRADPRVVRLGWGAPDEVDHGRAAELLELRDARTARTPVGQRLGPDEIVVALLRDRAEVSDAHDVVLRGLLDLLEGRLAGAAAQLEAGLGLAAARAVALDADGPLRATLGDLHAASSRARTRGELGRLADACRPPLLELRALELSPAPASP